MTLTQLRKKFSYQTISIDFDLQTLQDQWNIVEKQEIFNISDQPFIYNFYSYLKNIQDKKSRFAYCILERRILLCEVYDLSILKFWMTQLTKLEWQFLKSIQLIVCFQPLNRFIEMDMPLYQVADLNTFKKNTYILKIKASSLNWFNHTLREMGYLKNSSYDLISIENYTQMVNQWVGKKIKVFDVMEYLRLIVSILPIFFENNYISKVMEQLCDHKNQLKEERLFLDEKQKFTNLNFLNKYINWESLKIRCEVERKGQESEKDKEIVKLQQLDYLILQSLHSF